MEEHRVEARNEQASTPSMTERSKILLKVPRGPREFQLSPFLSSLCHLPRDTFPHSRF